MMRYPLLALLVAAVAWPTGAGAAPTKEQILAQQRACEAKKPQRKAAGTITESTYRKLERVIDAISKDEYKESEARLKDMVEGARGGYEKAVILQTLAFVYAQTNRNALAIKAFETAIAEEAMPQAPHEQMVLNVAQLYIADDKWDKGIKFLNDYMREACNPAPEAHILLASAYAERKKFREGLEQVDLALVKAAKPQESWLQLKLALHYELKQIPQCAAVLVDLVAIAPDKETYWKQLSGVLFEIRKDPEALATLALAERKGYIDEEAEYNNLANLYMYLEIPLKAARLMERGFEEKVIKPTEKNLEKLANAWLAAREYPKARVVMQRAAQVSDKGEIWKRLGQIYLEEEKWNEALDALTKARSKGGLKNPGEVHFLIGVASVELKQWSRAEAALKQAMAHEKTAKAAAEWLQHLQAEMAFAEQLAAPAEPDEDSRQN